MAEQSEHQSSQSGQPVEAPENVKRDRQGEPYASSQDGAVSYATEGDQNAGTGETATGYQESGTHVPDPTAMSGTLETSGTGGGANERISGMTDVFGPVERDIIEVRGVVQRGAERVVETVEHVLHQEPDPDDQKSPGEPQAPAAEAEPAATKAPAKKTTAKKTTDADK